MSAPPVSWVAAVRDFDWQTAARVLDALPDGERAAPEVRYVRARAAIELGDPARAATLLVDLESALPLLRREVAEQRGRAWLAAGQAEEAAAYFATKSDASSLLGLALALERRGQFARARQAADRALERLLGERSDEAAQAETRLVRARLAASQGDRAKASAIYRWLAVHVPESPFAAGAEIKLAELDPGRALTRAEHHARALSFARMGRVEATEQELTRLSRAPGPSVPEASQVFARALALYNARRDLSTAVKLLTRAAELDVAHRPRNLFLAARALARGFEDRLAIARFQELVRRYPQAPEAADARFQMARLSHVLGDAPAAIAGYSDYLARHGKRGGFAESARYERAVAYLCHGDTARAAAALAELASRQTDGLLRASYRELRAVALLGEGHRAEAEAELRAVIASEPLSLPALLAAARLRALGVAPPPPIAPDAEEAAGPALAVTLPPKVALLHRLGLDADAEAALAAEEAAVRRTFGDRGDEGVCRAYGELSVAARRYAVGRRATKWQAPRFAPAPRTRWLWDCLYPRPYPNLVKKAERTERLPAHLVYAVMRQESGFVPGVVSPARAEGLLQLIPPTAEAVAGDLGLANDPTLLKNPPHNIRLGAHYLRRVLDRFGERPILAAAAYNAGPQAVSHWLEHGESLPMDVFVARIPFHETRLYVHRVMSNLARYGYLAQGDAGVPRIELIIPRGLRAKTDDY
ncbi:MAG: transglycosylase SLT domain-containing protein [Polyangiaceae bacterium]|nr:transglycosylase SLT domain-containing protein [Polyangiaceae bacterium]